MFLLFNNFLVYFHKKVKHLVELMESFSVLLSNKFEHYGYVKIGLLIKMLYIVFIQFILLYLCNTIILIIHLIFYLFHLDLYYILKYMISLIKIFIKIYIISLCSWILILYLLLSYIEWINNEIHKLDKNEINIYFYLVTTYNYFSKFILLEINNIFLNINTLHRSKHVNTSISFDILDEYDNDDIFHINDVNLIYTFLENVCLEECYHWNDYLFNNIDKSEIIISRIDENVIVSEYDIYKYFILILDIFKIDIDYKGQVYSVYLLYYVAEKNIFMYYENGIYYYNSTVRKKIFYMSDKKDVGFENDVLLYLDDQFVNIDTWKNIFLYRVQFKDLVIENEKK